MGPPPPAAPGHHRARPCPCRSLMARSARASMTRLRRWFLRRIAVGVPVGGVYLSILSVYMFFITFTCPVGLLAAVGRLPATLPRDRRGPSRTVAAPPRRAKSIGHDTAAEKDMDYDGKCMHATANAHGDPQQRSRRRLRPIPHRSAPASPRHGSRRSDGGTRLDDSWRPPEEGRLRGYGQAWVTRAKREVLALKAARTMRSRASRHRHEKEGL